MGRSSMNSLKLALFPLTLLALISKVTSKPKHLLVETKGSGSSDDYSYPPPPPAYPPPTVYDYKNDKAKDYSYPPPPPPAYPQTTLHLQSTTIKTIKPKTIPTLHHLLQPTPNPTTIKTKTTTPLRLRPTPSTESRCT